MAASAAGAAAGMDLAGNIAAPIIQGAFTLGGTALQYHYNKKLAELQNQYNLDMWKRNNEYNSPQAQMQRFAEAGLNPNLIYGQGSNGNSSSPPQMVVPESPRVDKAMAELGKLFNLVNLRGAIADTKKKEQDAITAEINNENLRDERISRNWFAENWFFDTETGKFEPIPSGDLGSVSTDRDMPYWMRKKRERVGPRTEAYLLNKYKYENYRGLKPYTLYPSLINLRQMQARYLAPQILMKNYDWQKYPETFYIDRANKGTPGIIYGVYNGLKNFLGW